VTFIACGVTGDISGACDTTLIHNARTRGRTIIMATVTRSHVTAALSVALLASLVGGVEAVDGVQEINQELALAGNVTPGDGPGFPVTISLSGSYRLSGNLRNNAPDVDVIDITAANVTLDLKGFTIQGPRELCFNRIVPTWCGHAIFGDGVVSPRGAANVRVFNGTIRSVVHTGVWLAGPNTRIDGLTVTRNGGYGIVVGEGALVSNNIVTHNGLRGITRKSLSLNEGIPTAVGNVVQLNGKEGLYGFVMRDNVLWANNPGGPQVSSVIDAGGNTCDVFSC
jgi:hypothetical protein